MQQQELVLYQSSYYTFPFESLCRVVFPRLFSTQSRTRNCRHTFQTIDGLLSLSCHLNEPVHTFERMAFTFRLVSNDGLRRMAGLNQAQRFDKV